MGATLTTGRFLLALGLFVLLMALLPDDVGPVVASLVALGALLLNPGTGTNILNGVFAPATWQIHSGKR